MEMGHGKGATTLVEPWDDQGIGIGLTLLPAVMCFTVVWQPTLYPAGVLHSAHGTRHKREQLWDPVSQVNVEAITTTG